MIELSLFTGAGGGVLGTTLLGWRHAGYVEWEEYCQKVLAQRIKDGLLDEAPIFGDIRAFIRDGYAACYTGMVDVITFGDPCQRNSNAYRSGKPAESLGDEALEVVRIVRPWYVQRENPAHVRADAPWPAERIAERLEAMGYTTSIVEVRSCCVGHDHRRARLYVQAWLPDADSDRLSRVQVRGTSRSEGATETEAESLSLPFRKRGDSTQPRVSRGANGMAHRMDRLKAVGNGQDPRAMIAAWGFISGKKKRIIDEEQTH
jgi:DNA (cytosine-5)-methyltransferase 1